MKIAWYSPYSAASAIGRFSHLVVEQLRQRDVQVTLVRSETKSSDMKQQPVFASDSDLRWAADFDRCSKSPIDDCDLVVYNIGDHYENHAYCFHHLKRRAGISILHDFNLHNALFGFCNATAPTNGSYRDHLIAGYDERLAQRFDKHLSTAHERDWWEKEVCHYPLYRWALRNSTGIVTHADFYRSDVEARIGCPTTVIPLAYNSPCSNTEIAKSASSQDAGSSNQNRLRLVTVGAVNANKQYDAIIETLANSPRLRRRIEYRIVGPIDATGRRHLDQALSRHATPPDVTITGQVSSEQLRKELASADILSCLRFPALEGASASVIEAMMSSRAVLVNDTGCYSEIPDDLVFHVSTNRLKADLHRQLTAIVDDMSGAESRAAAARAWAIERHSPSTYAESFLSFIPTVLYNQPVLDVTDRLSRQLANWNLQANDTLLDRMESALADLFGSHDIAETVSQRNPGRAA